LRGHVERDEAQLPAAAAWLGEGRSRWGELEHGGQKLKPWRCYSVRFWDFRGVAERVGEEREKGEHVTRKS
jgi:hypothetical protein